MLIKVIFVYLVSITDMAIIGFFVGAAAYADPGAVIGAILASIFGFKRAQEILTNGNSLRTKKRLFGLLSAVAITVLFFSLLISLTV